MGARVRRGPGRWRPSALGAQVAVLAATAACGPGAVREPDAPRVASSGAEAAAEAGGRGGEAETRAPGEGAGTGAGSVGDEGGLAPLTSASSIVRLEVPRRHVAIVSVPVGARGPRPVIVAAHGAGDRPEWQCAFWRRIVQSRAFVLCPRGYPMNPHVPPEHTGYFYTTHHMLRDEVTAALAALSARFGAHVDLRAPVYSGFSQGAIMGALVLPTHPARFGRAVLIEGGYGLFQEWNRFVAKKWKERGGERVLVACGRAKCVSDAQASVRYMRQEGLSVRLVHAPGAGHTYGGGVGEEVARAFAWVVEGDARFAGGETEDADSGGAGEY